MSAATTDMRPYVALPREAVLTPTGLKLPDGLDFERWVAAGESITRAAGVMTWAIGDWLNYGHWEYGAKYEEGIARTGLDYGTLANIASVCERFDFSRRRENLSFGHHQSVTGLEPIDQERALDQAERDGLSVMALRNVVRSMRELPPRTAFPIRFSVELPPSQQARAERWRQAASASGQQFSDWAADALDRAAA